MAPRKHRRRKRHKDGDETPNEATVTQLSAPVEGPGPETPEETGRIQFEIKLEESDSTDGSITIRFSPTEHLEEDLPRIIQAIQGVTGIKSANTSPDNPETITIQTGTHDMTTLTKILRLATEAVSKVPIIGKYIATATTDVWTEPLQVNFTRHHKGGFIDEDGIEDADWTEVHETIINKRGVSRANIAKVINQNTSLGGHITRDAILVEVFSEGIKILTLQVDDRGFVHE